MKFSEYCLRKPVFTYVVNAIILLIGVLALGELGLREYPDVVIPKLTVEARYYGASPELVESRVTNVLEDKLSGIEGVDHMKSSSQDSVSNITLVFKPGSSIERATADIRDAISQAQGNLPREVKTPIIRKKGDGEGAIYYIAVYHPKMTAPELVEYIELNLANSLRTINGVAQIEIMGAQYVMEVDFDPVALHRFGLDIAEVIETISQHTKSQPAGKTRRDIPISLITNFSSPETLEQIVLSKAEDSVVQVKDIANVSLQGSDVFRARVNGRPGVLIGINKSEDGNPLEISEQTQQVIEQIQDRLPDGMVVKTTFDKAKFIRASLSSLKQTIIEAVLLVLIIIVVFLGSFRASLIPLLTIPLSLLGTMFVMMILGFTINTITLLSLVLAIGLVVDDAIVVLENIHRHIMTGKRPMEAAIIGMKEIGFAVIAMTFTLASVFMPVMFIKGTLGQLMVEFAITLVSAVIVSGFVALSLSPLMCARTLKQHSQNKYLGFFSRYLDKLESVYGRMLVFTMRWRKLVPILLLVVCSVGVALLNSIKSELAPKEDRGVVGIFIRPVAGSAIDEREETLKKVEKILLQLSGRGDVLGFIGPWGGNCITPLDDWSERKISAAQVVGNLRKLSTSIPSEDLDPWSWDMALPGVSNGNGDASDVAVKIMTTESYEKLNDFVRDLMQQCKEENIYKDFSHDLDMNAPAFEVKVDLAKAKKFGIPIKNISPTIEAYYKKSRPYEFSKGSLSYYVVFKTEQAPNDLAEVLIKKDSKGHNKPDKKDDQKDEKFVSIGSFAKWVPSTQPTMLRHYNRMRTAELKFSLPADKTMEEGMQYIKEKLQSTMPPTMSFKYAGSAKKFKESSNELLLMFLLALAFIYAILSVQFENFRDAFLIMFTVPLACTGGLALLWATGGTLNVFSQIGLITLIGLITKHGILMIDFANKQQGVAPSEAIFTAAKRRLRPILMTTGAMFFGALPLYLSTGAGSEARASIAVVLLGGLALGTLLTLFLLPSLYAWFYSSWLGKKKKPLPEPGTMASA